MIPSLMADAIGLFWIATLPELKISKLNERESADRVRRNNYSVHL
jgi:hypothetical protein